MTLKKDVAWNEFESIEIAWKDPQTGEGAVLFHGGPGLLSPSNKFPADGYRGQKIDILIKGYNGNKLAYHEIRGFDGANPATVTKVIVPIDTAPVAPPLIPGKPGAPILSAILFDTLISIHDYVAFAADAAIDSGTLKSYAWDYDGNGIFGPSIALTGKSARLTGGFKYSAEGIYDVALQIVSQADSMAQSRTRVTVRLDAPNANAGEDFTVYTGERIALHGIGKDLLGRIVRTEWKIGSDSFVPASPDTTFTAPATVQDIVALFRVTDDDTLSDLDSVIVHVISPEESNMTSLEVSAGRLSPRFDPSLTDYKDTVDADIPSITVTATGIGVIMVNGSTVASGSASPPIDLQTGGNQVSVSVQKAGAAKKTYTITVHRKAISSNAALRTLAASAGPLDKIFNPSDTVYTIAVPNSSATTTITASTADSSSSLKIYGAPATTGIPTGAIDLPLGESTVTVSVTAQDGTVRTYSLKFKRANVANADLSDLSLSTGALDSEFSPGVASYSHSVSNATISTAVTAWVNSSVYILGINGKQAVSGVPSTVYLQVGTNTIPIEVTSQSGDKKKYSITVTRAPNGNPYLSSLAISPGTLSPAPFDSATIGYTASVPNSVASITVTATVAATTSSLTINGDFSISGSASAGLNLAVGVNTIPVAVTAENGTKLTYTITITRADVNADATLSGHSVLSGD